MRIQGIAFDLEGTIIDMEALHHAAHLRAAADVGVALSWPEALERLPHFVGGPDEEVAAEIASLAGPKAAVNKVLRAKQRYFHDLLQQRQAILPRAGFLPFLRWVKRLGLKVAIGTVSPRALAIHFLERAGLLHEFCMEVIVAQEDVLLPKPAPDVYDETARRMGIASEGQLVLEDSVVGLRAARAAGCRLAAVPTIRDPGFGRGLYRAGAEAIFLSWTDPKLRQFILKQLNPTGNAAEKIGHLR